MSTYISMFLIGVTQELLWHSYMVTFGSLNHFCSSPNHNRCNVQGQFCNFLHAHHEINQLQMFCFAILSMSKDGGACCVALRTYVRCDKESLPFQQNVSHYLACWFKNGFCPNKNRKNPLGPRKPTTLFLITPNTINR